MQRREFFGLIAGAAAWPLATRAQQSKKIPRLAFLGPNIRNLYAENFFRGLRDLGYVDGENIQIFARFANGNLDLIPGLVAELVSLNPDVFAAATALVALPAKKATSTIPIVAIAMQNGVRMGLYESLAHPGGNVTGIDTLAELAAPKRVALLKEIVPQLSRLTLLYNAGTTYATMQLETILPALETMGLTSRVIEVTALRDFDGAFETMRRDPPQAIVVFLDPLVTLMRQRIIDLALEYKIPMIGEESLWVREGQLISYGASVLDVFYRGAYFVDKILKGAKPATLPAEQPTKIDLVINLKTAKAFGLRIPDQLLAIANEVIE